MWETWMYGLAVAFIVVLVFYAFTPFLKILNDNAYTLGNFTHAETNTSFHDMLASNKNMWNLWPIVAFGLLFVILFYMTSEDRKYSDLY